MRDLLADRGDALADESVNAAIVDGSNDLGFTAENLLGEEADGDEEAEEEPKPADKEQEDEEEEEEEPEDKASGEDDDSSEEMRLEIDGVGTVGAEEVLGAFKAQAELKELKAEQGKLATQKQELETATAGLEEARNLQQLLNRPAIRTRVIAAIQEAQKDPQANLQDGKGGEFAQLFSDPRIDQIQGLSTRFQSALDYIEAQEGIGLVNQVHDEMIRVYGDAYTPELRQEINQRALKTYEGSSEGPGQREVRLVAEAVVGSTGLKPLKGGKQNGVAMRQVTADRNARVRVVKGRHGKRAAARPMKDPVKMSDEEFDAAFTKGILGQLPQE